MFHVLVTAHPQRSWITICSFVTYHIVWHIHSIKSVHFVTCHVVWHSTGGTTTVTPVSSSTRPISSYGLTPLVSSSTTPITTSPSSKVPTVPVIIVVAVVLIVLITGWTMKIFMHYSEPLGGVYVFLCNYSCLIGTMSLLYQGQHTN